MSYQPPTGYPTPNGPTPNGYTPYTQRPRPPAQPIYKATWFTAVLVVVALIIGLVIGMAIGKSTGVAAPGQPGSGPTVPGSQSMTQQFGGTYTWPDGISVSVAAPQPYSPGDDPLNQDAVYKPTPGQQYVSIEVTVTNGSQLPTSASAVVSLKVLSNGAYAVEMPRPVDASDTNSSRYGAPDIPLRIGQSAAFSTFWAVDDPDDITVRVAESTDYGVVGNLIFTK